MIAMKPSMGKFMADPHVDLITHIENKLMK